MTEGTDASVDMEPEILFAGESRKRRQVVDGARVDRARGRDHAAGRKSVRPVFRDGGAQRFDVYSQRAVYRNAPQRLIAEAECLHRLAMTGMNLLRSVEAQGLFDRCDTELAHVHARLDVTCDRQADDVRHRAAADERAASGMRKADHGLKPVYDLPVHQCGGVTAAAEIGALDRSEEIANRAGEIARTHIPGPEARMDVAHRIGHYRLGDLAIDLGEQ